MCPMSDFARDWRRWTRAERIAATLMMICVPLIGAGISSLMIAMGRLH